MTGIMDKAKVKTDIKKNRIYITLPTSINTKELEKIYSEVRFGVADLKPGFDVVTDLSYCSIGHLSAIPTLRKITAYLVANKVGRVVRIVGNMSLILKQLIGIASKFNCYKPVYVGYDNIDVPEATKRRISVSNTPGVSTDATAELAGRFYFAVARRVVVRQSCAPDSGAGWGHCNFREPMSAARLWAMTVPARRPSRQENGKYITDAFSIQSSYKEEYNEQYSRKGLGRGLLAWTYRIRQFLRLLHCT